jgi:hypothetical protein
MNLLDQLLGWFRPPPQQGAGWLDWFNALSRGWSAPHALATSSAPSPITSTPAASPPPAAAPLSQTETGQALIALLDRIAK